MPDDDGGSLAIAVEGPGREEVARDIHLVLVLKGDLLQVHLVAGVEVVRSVGHVLSLCSRDGDERHHAERGDAETCKFEHAAAAVIDAVLFGESGGCCLHDRSLHVRAARCCAALVSRIKVERGRPID
jgi:hypothetical protein